MRRPAPSRDYAGLPTWQPAGSSPPRRRICLATQEVNGPFRNGGIGTAYTTLAEVLAARGHEVTLLFLRGDYSETGSLSEWIEHYRDLGIALVPLARPKGVRLRGSAEAATSYAAYEYLRAEEPDIVHFPELGGGAFMSLLAKRQGLCFRRTLFVVGTHSPMLWIRESNAEYLNGVADVEMDFMERRSVAMADVVVSPSRYMLEWMTENGWELPESSHVQQNLLPGSARRGKDRDRVPKDVGEVVFFGRLETRKGLTLFADALDRLAGELDGERASRLRVSFLGRTASVRGMDSLDYIESRARRWPFAHQVLENLGQAEAMRYLVEPGRLAVIPSFVENSPYTVLECLGAGIPFLAAAVGGIPELISEPERARASFTPTSEALAEGIAHALRHGARVASPAVDFDRNEREWMDWHERVPLPSDEECLDAGLPKVSVCLALTSGTAELAPALASVRALDYPDVEIVLAGEQGECPEASARGGERWVEAETDALGSLWNVAAREATGELLLFTTSDHTSAPNALRVYVEVARRRDADLVTSFGDGTAEGRASGDVSDRFLYLGAPAAGLFHNTFGRGHLLMKREAFETLGGFSEGVDLSDDDWGLQARAALSGRRVEIVPEALYAHHVRTEALVEARTPMRAAAVYRAAVPDVLVGFVELTQSIELRRALEAEEDDPVEPRPRTEGLDVLIDAAFVLADRGPAEEVESLLTAGIDLARSSGNGERLVDFLLGAARVLTHLDRAPAAIDLLAAAINVGSQTSRVDTFLHALIEAGNQLVGLGEFRSAEQALTAASDLAAQHERHSERLSSLIAKGWALGTSGDPDEAQRALLDALEQAKSLDDERALARLQLEAGARLLDLGLDRSARDVFLAAGQVGWQLGDRRLVAEAQRKMQAAGRSRPRRSR